MSTKIQYISDIHLEFYKTLKSIPKIPVNAEILVLAGDIGYPTLPIFWDFLAEQSQKFKHVILVAGNHEYYHTTTSIKKRRILIMKEIDEMICSEIKRRNLNNIHFLQCNSVVIDDIEFVGATLWTNISQNNVAVVSQSMNDYSQIFIKDESVPVIETVSVEQLNIIHKKHTEFLMEFKRQMNKKLVFITHHMPSFQMINKKYELCDINCAFASNILHKITEKPDVWICGHSHKAYNGSIEEVHCVMNPIGYPNENTSLNFGEYIII